MAEYQEGYLLVSLPKDLLDGRKEEYKSSLRRCVQERNAEGLKFSDFDEDERFLYVEFDYKNRVEWNEYIPATRWEPAEGGYYEDEEEKEDIIDHACSIIMSAGEALNLDIQYEDLKLCDYHIEIEEDRRGA